MKGILEKGTGDKWMVKVHTSSVKFVEFNVNSNGPCKDLTPEFPGYTYYFLHPDSVHIGLVDGHEVYCEEVLTTHPVLTNTVKIISEHKAITGWDTMAEFSAYQRGREDEEKVLAKWIETWDGKTNSAMGQILSDKLVPLVFAFYTWCESIRLGRDTNGMWFRITNNPKDWPVNLSKVTDKEVWNKFLEEYKK